MEREDKAVDVSDPEMPEDDAYHGKSTHGIQVLKPSADSTINLCHSIIPPNYQN